MFRRRDEKTDDISMNIQAQTLTAESPKKKTNTLLKGSKLTGDINISYDLELSGEVEGSITSEQDSNIVIKGVCKGNIKTKEGSVEIEGELTNGDIIAGGDIKITGKFNGGMAKSRGRVFVDGEFSGKLESNEIEIGPNAKGKGELFYKEYISIARGAQVEAQISQIMKESKETRKSPDIKVVNIERPIKEISGAK